VAIIWRRKPEMANSIQLTLELRLTWFNASRIIRRPTKSRLKLNWAATELITEFPKSLSAFLLQSNQSAREIE